MSAQRSFAYRWLPDDTEESVVGADWHQEAITNLWSGLRDVARGQGWPWHVGNQLTLVAWHPDGTRWRPIPDIMVHPQAGPARRGEMDAHGEGLPALIIEVASPSTYLSDVTVALPTRERPDAKGYEYLALPLPEYLVFDPTGDLLPGQVRAWQVVKGQGQTWEPDAEGRYHSQTLNVSFRPDGFFLRVFDPAGAPVPLDHESGDIIERLARRVDQSDAEMRAVMQRAEQETRAVLERAQTAEQELASLRAWIARQRGLDNG